MKIKILASTLLFCFLFVNLSHGLYGTRPMGMGGAFTAVADDANAPYWNPAGLALNPGVDLSGAVLLTNRNEMIGDNYASLKMCYETELNPFAWIVGIGIASIFALNGAKYLSDQGILKKNWGNSSSEKLSKEESSSEKVLESGTEKTVDVTGKIKETAKTTAKDALNTVTTAAQSSGNALLKGAGYAAASNGLYGPVYYRNYSKPTYWDDRQNAEEASPRGKAQFAGGFSFMTDKNAALNQNSTFYILSAATGYEERVAFGGNVNIYHVTIPSNNLSGYGGGVDFGFIAKPTDQIHVGIAAKEILTTGVYFDNGAVINYVMNVNAGAAVEPFDTLLLSIDVHNIFNENGIGATYHYGVEVKPFPGIAIRGGLHDQSKTAGASLMLGPVIFDYAYLGGTFSRTQMAGFTWKL